MKKELQKAIVLGGDNAYMDKIETTIKSICAHNRAVTFYVSMMICHLNGFSSWRDV